MKKKIVSLLATIAAAMAVDLFTKALAEQSLAMYRPVEIVGTWFRFTLTYNEGIAFGLFATDGPGVVIASGLATVLLATWLLHALWSGDQALPTPWALGLLLGGAVANLLDRLMDGRVTDFLDLGVGTYRWATFNFADVFIVVGVGLLLVASYRHSPEEERSTEPAYLTEPEYPKRSDDHGND